MYVLSSSSSQQKLSGWQVEIVSVVRGKDSSVVRGIDEDGVLDASARKVNLPVSSWMFVYGGGSWSWIGDDMGFFLDTSGDGLS